MSSTEVTIPHDWTPSRAGASNTLRPHSSLGYKPPAPYAVLWPGAPPSAERVDGALHPHHRHRAGEGEDRARQSHLQHPPPGLPGTQRGAGMTTTRPPRINKRPRRHSRTASLSPPGASLCLGLKPLIPVGRGAQLVADVAPPPQPPQPLVNVEQSMLPRHPRLRSPRRQVNHETSDRAR